MVPTKRLMTVIRFAALFTVCVMSRQSAQIAAAPVPPQDHADAALNIPCQADGLVLLLGTEIKEGDFVPVNEIVAVKIDGETKRFRRLKVGDKVEEGQVIGRLDDTLARLDVEVSKARLAAAEAKRRTAEKLRDDSKARLRILDEMQARARANVTAEEYRGAALNEARMIEEETAMAAEVKIATVQLKRSEHLLSQYEIRSVRGEVTAIVKRRGEAARAYETVVRIRPDEKDR